MLFLGLDCILHHLLNYLLDKDSSMSSQKKIIYPSLHGSLDKDLWNYWKIVPMYHKGWCLCAATYKCSWQLASASILPAVPCFVCLMSFHDLYLNSIPCSTGKGKDYWQDENIIEEMPCCRQMFNIFHPFDPVAYRFVAFLHFFLISCLEIL